MRAKYILIITALLTTLISCKKSLNKEFVETIDQSDMDFTVKPGDNFYQYVNGGWLKKIKENDTTVSQLEAFDLISETTNKQLATYVNELIKTNNFNDKTDIGKAINLYKTYIDSTRRNSEGIKPLENDLKSIDKISNLNDLNSFLISNAYQVGFGLYELTTIPNTKNSNIYTIELKAVNLGLPDPSYYLNQDPESRKTSNKYIEHIAKMLQFANFSENEAKKAALNIFYIEKQLAKFSFTRNEIRDPNLTYNPTTLKELNQINSSIKWSNIFYAINLKELDTLNVTQPKFYKELNNLLQTQDISTLKQYLKWKLIAENAENLSKEIALCNKSFHSLNILKQEEEEEEEEKENIFNTNVIEVINAHIPQALGKYYVEHYFSIEAKQEVEQMIQNIIAAYRIRIKNLNWMDLETKNEALKN